MIIKVDRSRCNGHAMCAIKGGEDIYPLDDEGFSIADGIRVSEQRKTDAILGALVCPERAITVIEEESGIFPDGA